MVGIIVQQYLESNTLATSMLKHSSTWCVAMVSVWAFRFHGMRHWITSIFVVLQMDMIHYHVHSFSNWICLNVWQSLNMLVLVDCYFYLSVSGAQDLYKGSPGQNMGFKLVSYLTTRVLFLRIASPGLDSEMDALGHCPDHPSQGETEALCSSQLQLISSRATQFPELCHLKTASCPFWFAACLHMKD